MLENFRHVPAEKQREIRVMALAIEPPPARRRFAVPALVGMAAIMYAAFQLWSR